MADESDENTEVEVAGESLAPVRRRDWHNDIRLGVGLAAVICFSVAMSASLPMRQSRFDFATTNLPDPGLKMDWKSVGNYVSEQNMTESMLASERLKHEAQQIEIARQADEAKKPIPTIKAPLLPGPVQRVEAALQAPGIVSPPGGQRPFIDEAANNIPVADDAAKPANDAEQKLSREQKFNQDMSTLEALQKALKALNTENKTAVEGYRNDAP